MKNSFAKIFAVILIALFVFAACGEPFKAVTGGPVADEIVYGNGGLAVRKGDYLFAINGTGISSADNTYGKVVKASIIRQDLNDLNAEPVVVVPKLAISSYAKGGFYIFGDRIYFASPSDQKDSKGNVLKSSLDFFSIKFDGTDLKRIAFVSSNSTPYRFYEDNGTVYLVYAESTNIYTINTTGNKKNLIAEAVSGSAVFADDGFIYFNKTLYKDVEGEKTALSYQDLLKVRFDGTKKEDVKIGDKKLVSDGSDDYNLVTLIDVIIFDNNVTLFYTRKSASISKPQTMPEAATYSFVIGASKEVQIDTNSSLFSDRIFLSPTSFIATLTKDGKSIVSYIKNNYYNNGNLKIEPEVPLMEKTSKILYTTNSEIYYLDSNNNLNKKSFSTDTLYGAGEVVLKDVSINVSGLSPEVIEFNDQAILVFVRNDGYYPSYLYAVDLKTENLEALFIGVATEADEAAAEEKREEDKK